MLVRVSSTLIITELKQQEQGNLVDSSFNNHGMVQHPLESTKIEVHCTQQLSLGSEF